jgi:hypothetical protein
MCQTKIVQEIKIYILFLVTFFFFGNRAVYEKMWKNIVEQGRPQVTIWRMRCACWIPKATNTYPECVLFLFSTATVVIRTRLDVTLYLYCLSCFVTKRVLGLIIDMQDDDCFEFVV